MAERLERVRASGRGAPVEDPEHSPVPTDEKLPDGQHLDHWVLSEEERSKGFVRPVRTSYRHVGPPGPRHELRDLTEEELERYAGAGYVKFEPYPESELPKTGRYWTQARLDAVDKGCGIVTRMGRSIAETYARDPHFYGSTFCVGCGKYLPVGEHGEFEWLPDYSRVGT